MRLAILSDVHGNSLALDAVLADIKGQGGVDGYWVLGDLAALGPDPIGALERIYALPNVVITRGNTDDNILPNQPPLITAQDLVEPPERLTRLMAFIASFGWTTGALAATEFLDKLAALPLEHRLTLPDGTRVLGVHAAPGTNDGAGIHPRQTEDELRAILAPANADLVFVGHTHWAMDVTVGRTRVVNLGSVSLPNPPDLRAKYTILDAGANGYRLEHRRVAYYRDEVIAQTRRSANPAADLIARYLRGEQKTTWSANLSAAEAERLGLPPVLIDVPVPPSVTQPTSAGSAPLQSPAARLEKNPTSHIYPNVHLPEDAMLGAFVIVGEPARDRQAGQVETHIGAGAVLRSHTVIYAGNIIGADFQTGHGVLIRQENQIGDNVSIGSHSIVEHHVKIGNNVRLHSNVFVPEFSILEDNCWLGPHVVVTNARYPRSRTVREQLKGAHIKRGAKIGANATLLPGVVIGENSLVGAGAVVTHDVPDGAVVAGNPARVINSIADIADYS